MEEFLLKAAAALCILNVCVSRASAELVQVLCSTSLSLGSGHVNEMILFGFIYALFEH